MLVFFVHFSVSAICKSRLHFCSNRCKCHQTSVPEKYSLNRIWNWFNAPDSIVHSFFVKSNHISIAQSSPKTVPILATMKWLRFVENWKIIRRTWVNRPWLAIGIEYHRVILYWTLICTSMKWPLDIIHHFGNDSAKFGSIICRYFWCAHTWWKS